jgi:glycosyltransferase involved in cell wall biosynthesis
MTASEAYNSAQINPLRLAVFCDYREEGWPSMDLVGEMLLAELRRMPSVRATEIQPRFRHRAQLVPLVGRNFLNADRLMNRFWDYPRIARRSAESADCFHVVDHSYSQLIHRLPAERAGVFCHDLDTFRCLLDPAREPRGRLFKGMARRILSGFQNARIVFHSTTAVRDEIVRHNLVDPERLVHAPYGHSPEFRPDAPTDSLPIDLPKRYLLHVGSCIPRKRIDVLLDVFARVSEVDSNTCLVQVGGEWTDSQRAAVNQLPCDRVRQYRGIDRRALAAIYRQAAVVLQTSEAEGFGLPVIEALACGAAVIASDIPVLREVGGEAVVYCPVGDVDAWTTKTASILAGACDVPTIDARLARASEYSWTNHARTILAAYQSMVHRNSGAAGVQK